MNALMRNNRTGKIITYFLCFLLLCTNSHVALGAAGSGGPENYKWFIKNPAAAPSPRTAPLMAYDAKNGKLVLFGGWTPNGRLDDTWTWDGLTWTKIETDEFTTPPARSGGGIVYDKLNQQILMFGGAGSSERLGDTWRWTGSGWENVTPADPFSAPAPRSEPHMAYDETRGETVLFGGASDEEGFMNDTWTWNNQTLEWNQELPVTVPTPRSFGIMAYDGNTEKIVLFGGIGGAGRLNDTWVWNGSNWANQSMISPPSPRLGAGVAFDSKHLILFGGDTSSGMIGDLWFWNGTEWILQANLQREEGHGHVAMAYDSDRKEVVVFGGNAPSVSNETSLLYEVPLVTTEGVSDLTTDSAVLAGNVSYAGRFPVTERGFVLSRTADPSLSDIKIPDGQVGLGSFSAAASGLDPQTVYHYRAYAMNAQGIEYGSDQTFTTVGITQITLDSDYNLYVDETHQSVVTAYYTNGSTAALTSGVTFSSGNPEVAVVGPTGVVAAQSPGIAVITASYQDKIAQARVTVEAVPVRLNGLTLSRESVSLQTGSSASIHATAGYSDNSTKDVTEELAWSFSDPSIASINKGIITGIKEGTTTATAAYGDQIAHLNITISRPVARQIGLSLSPEAITVEAGDSAFTQATAIYSDDTAYDVTNYLTWSFTDSQVASIHNGMVTGISAGTTVATAVYGDQTVRLDITVTPEAMPEPEVTPPAGEEEPVIQEPEVTPPAGEDAPVVQEPEVTPPAGEDTPVTQEPTTTPEVTEQPVQSTKKKSGGGGAASPANPATTTPNSTNPEPAPSEPVSTPSPFVSSVIPDPERLVSRLKGVLETNKNTQTTFTDTVSHWGSDYIALAARLNIIEGYEDGTLQPNDSVTRAEFSAMIVRAFDLSASSKQGSFVDLDQESWAASYIDILASNGVINGYPDGTFQPNKSITRSEMLAIISRILNLKGLQGSVTGVSFADVTQDYWAKDTIEEAAKAGIIEGLSPNSFAPEHDATRVESLTLIIRTLKTDVIINNLLSN